MAKPALKQLLIGGAPNRLFSADLINYQLSDLKHVNKLVVFSPVKKSPRKNCYYIRKKIYCSLAVFLERIKAGDPTFLLVLFMPETHTFVHNTFKEAVLDNKEKLIHKAIFLSYYKKTILALKNAIVGQNIFHTWTQSSHQKSSTLPFEENLIIIDQKKYAKYFRYIQTINLRFLNFLLDKQIITRKEVVQLADTITFNYINLPVIVELLLTVYALNVVRISVQMETNLFKTYTKIILYKILTDDIKALDTIKSGVDRCCTSCNKLHAFFSLPDSIIEKMNTDTLTKKESLIWRKQNSGLWQY